MTSGTCWARWLGRRSAGQGERLARPGPGAWLPEPELFDSRRLLRAGDSLILVTDGITEARSHLDRELYGEERLRDCIAGLGEASAAWMADAIQQAALAFSGEGHSDDTVALVLKIPSGSHRVRG